MSYFYGQYPTTLFVFDKVYDSKAAMDADNSPVFIGRYAIIQYVSEYIPDHIKKAILDLSTAEEALVQYDEIGAEYWDNYYNKDSQTNYDGTIWKMTKNGYEFFASTRTDTIFKDDYIYLIDGGTATEVIS